MPLDASDIKQIENHFLEKFGLVHFHRLAGTLTRGQLAGEAVQAQREGTGSVAASGTATVTFDWDPDFADDNYTVALAVEDANNDLRLQAITAQTASQLSVVVSNSDAANSAEGSVHAVAVYDG